MRKWLGVLGVLVWGLAGTALAGDWPEQRHLQVVAEGQVEAVPDIAHITARVALTGRETGDIKRQVDTITEAVLVAARRHGLGEKAVRAAQIRVAPEYDWQDGKRQLRGYRVERQIFLTLEALDRYSALVDDLVKAGITQLDGVQFDLSNRDALQLQAMEKALAVAEAKAQTLARGLGRKLDGVYRVLENGGGGQPVPVMAMRAELADTAPAMPLGVQTVRANLTVIYLLR